MGVDFLAKIVKNCCPHLQLPESKKMSENQTKALPLHHRGST